MSRSLSTTLLAVLALLLLGSHPAPDAAETVCVLDFLALDEAEELAWMRAGLADMMIRTLGQTGSYLVLERRHLQELLREHDLGVVGITDEEAVRRARLARADLLLLGSFARTGRELTVQTRLLRLSDQSVLSRARWSGDPDVVLQAPPVLVAELLESVGAPALLPGLESEIPRRIDIARAHYTGLQAFDDGRYPDALAHYLEASGEGAEFAPADDGVLEMYYLLGQSEHAVLAALRLARRHEESGAVARQIAYLHAAAARALDPLEDWRTAVPILENLLRHLHRHELETGDMARTKEEILRRLDELRRSDEGHSFGKLLSDGEIRHRMWAGEIERALERRSEDRARGGYGVLLDGHWVTKPVSPPTLFMWKVRAQRTLARLYAREGRIRDALDLYETLLSDHAFLTDQPGYDGRLLDPVRHEAHFMMLRHYAETGELVRDHPMNRINRLNLVRDGQEFERDFVNPTRDPRARTSSRYEHPKRGFEYFDFAAPAGYQIDSITLRAHVAGLAGFSVSHAHATGWPPQFSFGKRVAKLDFRKGRHEKAVRLPEGTEFVGIGTSWGVNPYEIGPVDALWHRHFGPDDGKDLLGWSATFSLSRKAGPPPTPPAVTEPQAISPTPYAADWDESFAVPVGGEHVYSGRPRLDVYAEDWLPYDLNGDLRIVRQREPHLEVRLPVTINTDRREFSPSLVRTHDGRWALLWARGTSKRNARRFVAVSSDLVEWGTPQALVFEELGEDSGYTYSRTEPAERTHNIVTVPGGYLMLLAQGFVRRSEDLRYWDAPTRVLFHDSDRNCLIRSADGTLWAIWETWSDELHPYEEDDWLHGFYVTDGKKYRHTTELHVASSRNGTEWTPLGKRVLPGQGSALWAFPVSDGRIGIAMGFNNLFVRWFLGSREQGLRDVDVDLRLMHQHEMAGFYVRGDAIACVRPVFDYRRQEEVLVGVSSSGLYRELLR
jgi:tetratricopeptide (TPR) repeat protein